MDWFERIRKAPSPYYGNESKYYYLQIKDVPGLEYLFDPSRFPMGEKLHRDLQPKAHFIDSNRWRPSISNRRSAIMMVTILDLKAERPIFDWALGRLQTAGGQEPPADETELAAGKKAYNLKPHEVGIQLIYRDSRMKGGYLMNLSIHIPKDNEFDMYVNRLFTHDADTTDYMLTNGEAAALLIMTQMVDERSKQSSKEQQKLFEEFGLGALSRDTDSKYIKSLVDKGLLRREAHHRTPSMRNYPRPTPKGRAVSNQFEMTRNKFHSEFKAEVKSKPDEEFTMFDESGLHGHDLGFGEDFA